MTPDFSDSMLASVACVLQSRGSIVGRPRSASLQVGSLFPARGVAHVFSFFVWFSLGHCWRASRAFEYVRVLERHARPFVKKEEKKKELLRNVLEF